MNNQKKTSAEEHTTERNTTTYRLYIRKEKKWEVVDKAVYEAVTKTTGNYRDRQRKRNECNCPKRRWWMCDCDCLTCPFFNADKHLSLDQPAFGEEGEEITLMMTIEDPTSPSVEKVVEDQDEVSRLRQAIKQLAPEERKIVKLIMAKKSLSEIAAIMGFQNKQEAGRKRDKVFAKLKKTLAPDN